MTNLKVALCFIETREIDGKLVEVKVYPPSKRRAHACIKKHYNPKAKNQRAAFWLAKDKQCIGE